jgi:phosphoesterase RecJ-like protein
MSVTIREQDNETCKVSIRTVEVPNANSVCGLLGGGGHGHAAGASLRGTIAEVKAKTLDAIARELNLSKTEQRR